MKNVAPFLRLDAAVGALFYSDREGVVKSAGEPGSSRQILACVWWNNAFSDVMAGETGAALTFVCYVEERPARCRASCVLWKEDCRTAALSSANSVFDLGK